MKKQTKSSIKAHLIWSALILLSLFTICVIPFALGRPIQRALPGQRLVGKKSPQGTVCTPGWSAGPNLPFAGVRFAGVFFPANGKFYAMGGRDASDVEFMHPFEYDPVSNTWTTKGATYPDTTTNNMACSVLTDSGTPYIYCVGGSNFVTQTGTGRVFRYDPVADSITVGAAPWPPGANSILPGGWSVFSNKMYILGGFDIPNGIASNQIWEYTVSPAGWVQKAAVLPVPLGYIPTATIGSLIYTGGGADITGGTLTDTTNSFKYDPVADSITTITAIPRATSNTRGLNFNGHLWVPGGQFPTPGNEVDIYDPVANSWSVGPPMLTARRNSAMDTNGTDHIWAAGGYDATGVANMTMDIFCQGGGTPTPTPACTPGYTTATGSGTITPGGTDIGNHCDDCTTDIVLPFPVSVYGNAPVTAVAVGSDGDIHFPGPYNKLFWWMGCVPVDPGTGQDPFLNTLFPNYADLVTDETVGPCTGCGIFTQTLGTAPNRQFVIRWKTNYFNSPPGPAQAEFEVLLTEGSNTLSVIYGVTGDNGLTAVSGIQKDLTVFTSFSCNEATLTPGLRVDYIPTGCGSPTPTPTATATATATAAGSPTATATATATPTATSTPAPRSTPTPRPRPTLPPRP